MSTEYVIGIDLGTTNSVLAYASLHEGQRAEIGILAIPQVTAPGTVEALNSLPSFIYMPAEHEQGESYNLPWGPTPQRVVGEMARRQSAEFPDRSVGGAKSWLAHSRVDRHDAILPWNAPAEISKISPVAASQAYLQHLIDAWNHAFPDSPFEQQLVVLTVPASFDASARELTREAAVSAGVSANFVLLEEPQAAVYAWLADQGDEWRRQLKLSDCLLVCDVGGGTTDLSLIVVGEQQGELVLQRRAVGNHLLVGGDNMDLALAHYTAELFQERGTTLDAWQSVALWHACRNAKESLLAPNGPASHKLTVLGRGSKLIGGAVSVQVDRDAVANLLVEGFFPSCELDVQPARRRQSGFVQLGLPFEADTGITRHVAAFLNRHAGDDGDVSPSHVLFNGGVFHAQGLRAQMLNELSSWYPSRPIGELSSTGGLDAAVARGAAYYGWSKQNGGVRIRGGTARSYYIGIETSGLAIPGAERPLRAVCVVPFGMEEGTHVDVPATEVGLVLGESVHFRFFSSSIRQQDRPGDVLDHWNQEELQETDSLEAELPAGEGLGEDYVPVRFQSRVTELGVFELWCVSTTSDDRWKLEFSVRESQPQ